MKKCQIISERDSTRRKKLADFSRLSLGFGLILSFFLPMGIYYYSDGDGDFHPLYGFLVLTSYICLGIGFILIFYYKLSPCKHYNFEDFLMKAIILILSFDWIVNIWLIEWLIGSDLLIDEFHSRYWMKGSDLRFEFYNGSLFFILTSWCFFSLRKFHQDDNKVTSKMLILSMTLFFLFILYRIELLRWYYP